MTEGFGVNNHPTPRANEAALVLRGICRAIEAADQDSGNLQATSDWLVLIGAATQYAHYLLTDTAEIDLREPEK